jgi:cytochrome c-type biogenesis protein CcmH/NrfG
MPTDNIQHALRAVTALMVLGLVACGKKDAPPTEAPPPAASSQGPGASPGLPNDPELAQAMDRVVEYRMRVDKDPNDVEALAELGNANLALKRFDHAVQWYERALKVDPNRTQTRMDLAIALRFLGKPDEAIAELNKVLAKDPKNAAALYNLGVILLEDKHDQQKAIAKWEALMKAHPDYPHAAELRQVVESLKQAGTAAPPAAGG